MQSVLPRWQTSTLSFLVPQRALTTVSVTEAVAVQPEALVAVTV